MNSKPKFIGILSCSGEEFPGGTISRIATRKVLDQFLPQKTTTICVPLFLAGDEQEREFVKNFPCISVDGCEKRCAARSVEHLGKKPAAEYVIPEYFSTEEHEEIKTCSVHDLKWKDHPYCTRLAESITQSVIKLINKDRKADL